MSILDGTESQEPVGSVEDPQAGSPEGQQPEGGGNPAWDSLRGKLDPVSFKAIESDLRNWESEAQKRIETNNSKYSWANELVSNGVTPEQIQQSLLITRQLNESPEKVFEALETFLTENGRIPTKAELKQEVKDNQDDPGGEPQTQADPRIDQIAEQQQRMADFLESQQQAAAQKDADDALAAEIEGVKKAHPEFDDRDIHEVIQRAALAAQLAASQGKQVQKLDFFAQDYVDNVRNRILSTPRTGDLAPKLLPTSGGNPPAANTQQALGYLSNGQTVDLVAELLTKGARQ
jgi:hypothetical protein